MASILLLEGSFYEKRAFPRSSKDYAKMLQVQFVVLLKITDLVKSVQAMLNNRFQTNKLSLPNLWHKTFFRLRHNEQPLNSNINRAKRSIRKLAPLKDPSAPILHEPFPNMETQISFGPHDPVWVTNIPREFYDFEDFEKGTWDNYDLQTTNDTIYHNNFVNNGDQVHDHSWDYSNVPPPIFSNPHR